MTVSRQSIGKYQIISELGRGATGKVYLADDPFGRRRVAIKIAYPEALNSSEDSAFYRSMFLNEASLAGKLNHPHIVQIYDAVVEEKSSYIVMEYVEGGTLEKFCAPQALLEPREVAEIVFKCVRALAFAQTLGLTHRDLKPGNILHKEGTEIKIADFGAAINRVSDRTMITNVGSPAYMAPELVTGAAEASHLSDIYALGVVMYYLLAGKLPFSGANTMSVIYQIVNTEPEPPSKAREIPQELDDIVMKAIRKDPAQRYQTWDEFGLALAETWKKDQKAEEKRDQSDTERFQLMRTLPFFKDFPENELWEVLKLSKWAKFKPDTALIKEGDHGDSFFILAGGYVRVTRGKRTLNVLTAGDCFGEMSYLTHDRDGQRRSATVTTTSDAIVMKIRAEDLRAASLSCRRLFDERFLNTLVSRLEAANEQLAVMS
jgi:serine/threonine protein kinase